MIILFILFCCVILLILKCFVLVTFWVLRKFKNIQISCQSSNLVWYKNIVFSSNSNLEFSVNNIWLSSSYVNSSFNKPLVIGLSGCNVRVRSKFKRLPEEERGDSNKTGSKHLQTLLRFMKKITALCICDLSVEHGDKEAVTFIESNQILLHVEREVFQNVPTICLLSQGFSVNYIPHLHESKVVEFSSDSTFKVSMTLHLSSGASFTPVSIQSLKIDCSQLRISLDGDVLGLPSSFGGKNKHLNIVDEDSDIYDNNDDDDDDDDDGSTISEGDDDVIENRLGRCSYDDEAETAIKKEEHSKRKLSNMLRFIPVLLQINIKDTKTVLQWEIQERNVSTSWKDLSLTSEVQPQGGDDSHHREVKVDISDLKMGMSHQDMFSVEQIGCQLMLSKEELSVTLNCKGGHVTYLHDEVIFCSHLVRHLVNMRPSEQQQQQPSSKQQEQPPTKDNILKRFFTSGVLQIKFYANIYSFTFAVSHGNNTQRFVLGLPGVRVSALGSVQDELLSDYILEVEVTSTYLRLLEQDNNNNNNLNNKMEELCAKKHFWDTPMYLGLLFLKMTKYGNHISIECMVDNLRFETSGPILATVQSLDDILRQDLVEFSHWLKARRMKSVPKTDHPPGQARKSVQLFLQMSCFNVFLCHENNASVMLRCDSASVPLSSATDVNLIIFGVKATHFFRTGKFHAITKSSDISNEILSVPMASINFNLPLKNVVVEAAENVLVVWSYSAHLCLHEVSKRLLGILKRGPSPSKVEKDDDVDGDDGRVKEGRAERVEVMLFFSCSIRVNLPSNHFMKVDVKNLQLEQTSTDGIIIKTSRLLVSSDQHPFLTFENLKVKSDLRGEKLSSERSLSSHDLQLPLNRAWIVTAEELSFVFAFDYNFASWFEEVKSLRKWLKLKHSKAPKVASIAADVCLLIDCIKIQICDDPFEVKLGDNYELLCDESLENEKRMNALNKRIEELKMKSSFIPEEKLDSLYISLSEKMSQVYIQRANQMYSQSPMRNSLCMWVIQSFELILLADPSMTSKSDIMNFMQEVNSESPQPKELEVQTCFLRKIRCSTSSIIFQLRDFPHPMLQIEDWLISGRFCGLEASGTKRGQKTRTIHLGHPWGTSTITKNIPPIKLYYDITSELKSFSMTYGSCWEPIVSQISLSMNKIFPPPCDPSPALPFWDKWRYLLHGNFVVLMEKGSWMCHASLDPYNTTEFMDWTWSDFVFKWVTGEVIFEGDLEILLRTASKYDECCFLKWNSLQLMFKLDWQCLGDPNDHHSVKPCSPEYVAIMLQNKDHDTYVNFRSSSLTFGCSMRSAVHPLPLSPLNFSSTSPGDLFSPGPSSSPKCLFYSSTIRWLDHLKVCLAKISRPIRRGHYFNTPVTGKPKFSRHISCLNFTLVLPSLNCSYWSSFRRSFGVELNSGPIRLDASASLETRQPIEGSQEAGLRRRPQRVVHAMKLQAHFESLAVWLSSQIHQRKTKFKALESERSFLLSVDKVNYQRIEEQQDSEKQASDEPLHQVEVHNLKACWTPYNRDIVFALHDSYTKSQMLQRNLSADAFKGIKVEASCQTPKKPAKPVGHHFSFSPSNQPPHADALLQKLISESQSKFVAVHEEISGAGVDMEHLQGYQVCQTDDVLRKNWIVTLVNSQVMLSGCETSGCIIVSTPKASLLSCLHHPVITSNHQLRSKTTLVGSVESMQYYATITDDIRPENIRWLTTRDIEERQSVTNQGSMNSLTLENIINGMDDVETDVSHIQRIISRCQCQFYWSWYGELEDDILEVPLQKIEEYSDVMKIQEGIDAFTLIHHDLNICTNSVQYATALDIVNNLLLHVEPKKKEQLEKLMDMRFKLQLSSDADQKTPIFVKQNHLRRLTEKMRVLEKEVYLSQRTSFDGETQELLKDLEDTKEQINFLSEELALMLSCYRESLLQTSSSSSSSSSSQKQSTMKREAMMTKKIDFYLQHVEWRLNESDGQIGISHIVLSNFLYTKAMHENDCGSHQLELGWCHVTNLLPEDQAYRDVLVPQDPLGRASLGNRRAILRVLCKFRSPVGGISIKEHLEVNVIPLTIQMTARFYSVVMLFFFPGKPVDSDEESVSDVEESQSTSSLTLAPSKRKFASLRKKSSTMSSVNDIDKMKERAAKNNMFIYIKISDVSLKVSYKSEKDKHIMNIKDFQFLSPMLEYHNQTWSWHDLTITLKKECKKVIIAQAVRQKLHIKSRSLFSDMMTFPRGVTGSEEDKTKLLLGLSIPETKQKKSKKRSLFGK